MKTHCFGFLGLLRIFVLFSITTLMATQVSAQSDYIKRENRDQTLFIYSPDFEGIKSQFRSRASAETGSRSEWVRWGYYKRNGAHLTITRQISAWRFEFIRVGEWFDSLSTAKKIDYKFTGNRFKISHKLGDFEVRRYNYQYRDVSKSCFAFSLYYDASSEHIAGYYCKKPGERASDNEIKELISSISIGKPAPH